MAKQVYTSENVLEATKKRISNIFDNFKNVSVSISGGKDSTVCAFLAIQEAKKRNRKVSIFFLDEEVDYEATIDQVKYIMFEISADNVQPIWFQFPFNLTNATSLTEEKLVAWQKDKYKIWMRAKESFSYGICPYPKDELIITDKNKGFDFYDVLNTYEEHQCNTCFIIGLRATESLNRWRVVSKYPAFKDWNWTSKSRGKNNIKAYPIYDWTFGDVWKFIADNHIRYNRIYDFMFLKNMSFSEFRVSSLIHEKSFKSIISLPEFEPRTYEKLQRRIKGIQTANIYANDKLIYKCQQLPANYKNWKEYRDFLITTYPNQEKISIFIDRFSKQPENEIIYKQQCRQLILNDLENNLPIDIKKIEKNQKKKNKWMNIL